MYHETNLIMCTELYTLSGDSKNLMEYDLYMIQNRASLTLCFLCNLGLPSQSSSIRRKMCHAPNTATLQHNSSSYCVAFS